VITFYHHTKCKTSRDALEILENSGEPHQVVLYVSNPPSETELRHIIKATGGSVRDILRQKGTPFDELDLGNTKWTDEDLIGFMLQHPILMNRPIAVKGNQGALCRPPEKILDLLD
jgi:arsenate reductase (glutaredoxin)